MKTRQRTLRGLWVSPSRGSLGFPSIPLGLCPFSVTTLFLRSRTHRTQGISPQWLEHAAWVTLNMGHYKKTNKTTPHSTSSNACRVSYLLLVSLSVSMGSHFSPSANNGRLHFCGVLSPAFLSQLQQRSHRGLTQDTRSHWEIRPFPRGEPTGAKPETATRVTP